MRVVSYGLDLTAWTLTIIIMSERRRRRRGEIAVLGPSTTTLNTVQTTTTMTTGEKPQSLQTRSLRPPSSNLAKWFVLLCLGPAHLTVMVRRTQSRNFLNLPPNCVLRSNPVSPQLPKVFAWRMLSSFLLSQLALIPPRLRVTEQPYKIPFYAALLYYLSIPTSNEEAGASEENTTKPPLGRLILDDFWKGFQAYLDKLAWRETRLCVRPDYPILPAPRSLTLSGK
jgi:hypothetical protein